MCTMGQRKLLLLARPGNFKAEKTYKGLPSIVNSSSKIPPLFPLQAYASNFHLESMSTEAKITMNLLIDRNKQKVLFAEAAKECVDLLFHMLQLPIATVVKRLTKETMAGSLGILYNSLENLSNDVLEPNVSKRLLLNPTASIRIEPEIPFLMIDEAPTSVAVKTFYGCPKAFHVTDAADTLCPDCNAPMSKPMKYIMPPVAEEKNQSERGYVKRGTVNYVIMDDLAVRQMSTISCVTTLNKLDVKDLSCVEERMVSLDINQAMALLKVSLTSKTSHRHFSRPERY